MQVIFEKTFGYFIQDDDSIIRCNGTLFTQELESLFYDFQKTHTHEKDTRFLNLINGSEYNPQKICEFETIEEFRDNIAEHLI